jgi:four helix bundle protein
VRDGFAEMNSRSVEMTDKDRQQYMFSHENLDVYRVSLEFVAWSYNLCKNLTGVDRHCRDQLLRAGQSIPLNIAEGNGKRPSPDRRRFFQIAYGSALESAATLDVLVACQCRTAAEVHGGKLLLSRVVAMLIRLTGSSGGVAEEETEYGAVNL